MRGEKCELVVGGLFASAQSIPSTPCRFLNLFCTSPLCILFLITQPNAQKLISRGESAAKLNTYESNTLLKHLGQPKRSDDATL